MEPALHLAMKRILQHSKTGFYLKDNGAFTPRLSAAHVCPNLAAAMVLCARLRLNPTDFVYRIVEPPVLLTPEFAEHCKAA